MKNFGNKSKKIAPDYIYGRNTCLSAIEANNVKKVFLQNGFADEKILNAIKLKKLPFTFVDLRQLNEKSKDGNHQGIVAEAKPYEYFSLEDIIASSKSKKQPLVLILDEVEDPHNFGAILRSADAFGVDGVIIKTRNQVPINMTVAKVSTGAIDYVKVAQVSNINSAILKLKENGFWIYAAEGSGKDNYQDMNFDGAVALIVGSEGRGVSKLAVENSDFLIKIPMIGHVNSLNVSVSTGILLSRIRNK